MDLCFKLTLHLSYSIFLQPTFIDMTEAQVMSKPPSFLDVAQASSFCSEMFALIPENLMDVALDALRKELDSGVKFPNTDIRSVLEIRLQS